MNSLSKEVIPASSSHSVKGISPKLTIIVPVYRVEAYLCACLDRVLQQTFSDFELILVDDGSPDRCGEMCDEYAKKDDRIVVIHKENGGLSSARNAALDIAKGDYITFMDSDDEFGTLTTIEENIDIMLEDTSVDIVQYPTSYIDLEGNSEIKHDPAEDILIDDEERYLRLLNEYVITHTVSCKIYKRTLFDTLRFPIGKVHEDFFLHLDLSDKFHKIVLSNRSFYNYYEREGSITQSKFSRNRVVNFLETEVLMSYKLAKYPSLSRLLILRYSDIIARISNFKQEFEISGVISDFHRARPSIRHILSSFFAPNPRHLVRHVTRIVLFSIFRYTNY